MLILPSGNDLYNFLYTKLQLPVTRCDFHHILQVLNIMQWFSKENLSWLHLWSYRLWPQSWRMWYVSVLINYCALVSAHFYDGSYLCDFEILPNKSRNSVTYWLYARSSTSYTQSNHNIPQWENTKYEFWEISLNKHFSWKW